MTEPMTPCACITAHDRMVCVGWCKPNRAWEYRCQSCGANLAEVMVDGVKLPRVERCDDCLNEARLRALGFEPVNEEQRAENLLVNLGVAK